MQVEDPREVGDTERVLLADEVRFFLESQFVKQFRRRAYSTLEIPSQWPWRIQLALEQAQKACRDFMRFNLEALSLVDAAAKKNATEEP